MKTYFLFLAMLVLSTSAGAIGTRGGGDLCEDRIKIISTDLMEWIQLGDSGKLHLPDGLSHQEYAQKMTEALSHTKILCVGEGDPGFPVNINGTPKVCVFEKAGDGSSITCDYAKFNATKDSDQYVLIHHEYAGVSSIEPPDEANSNYDISNQISGYLQDEIVKKLVVKKDKNRPIPGACDRSDVMVAALEEGFDASCGEIQAEDLAQFTGPLNINEIDKGPLLSGDFDGLKSLKNLSISSIDMTHLDDESFHDLVSLEELAISDPKYLKSLPSGFLSNLVALNSLYIKSDELTSLPSEFLTNLVALKSFNLHTHRLLALPNDLFQRLTNLNFIQLHIQGIEDIPSDLFQGLTSLKSLEIIDAADALNENLFQGLPGLEELRLDASGPIRPGQFRGLVKLKVLSALGGGDLQEIPEGLFQDLQNLEELGFDFSSLQSLPAHAFQGLSALKKIDLSYGKLRHIEAGTFKALTKLQSLKLNQDRLAGGGIDELPEALFEDLRSLKNLDLSHNNLTTISEKVFGPDQFPNQAKVSLISNPLSPATRELLEKQLGERVYLGQ
jgi:Leucine-rich repeat (LRR) protein